jgi:flavin-dependent dehydrogenase
MRRHYRVRPWSEFMEIHWGPGVQGYVTPIADEEACVVMMGESLNDVAFERALEVMPELRERLRGAEIAGRERGAITAIQSLECVRRGNIALVGDASGGVDAITGEGLRLSFRQATALADAMERGDLAGYQREHRRLGYRPSWMAARLLQLAKYDGLRGNMLKVLAQNPELFARLLAVHVGSSTRRDALATSAALGWQLLTN